MIFAPWFHMLQKSHKQSEYIRKIYDYGLEKVNACHNDTQWSDFKKSEYLGLWFQFMSFHVTLTPIVQP